MSEFRNSLALAINTYVGKYNDKQQISERRKTDVADLRAIIANQQYSDVEMRDALWERIWKITTGFLNRSRLRDLLINVYRDPKFSDRALLLTEITHRDAMIVDLKLKLQNKGQADIPLPQEPLQQSERDEFTKLLAEKDKTIAALQEQLRQLLSQNENLVMNIQALLKINTQLKDHIRKHGIQPTLASSLGAARQEWLPDHQENKTEGLKYEDRDSKTPDQVPMQTLK